MGEQPSGGGCTRRKGKCAFDADEVFVLGGGSGKSG
jgi:hypothetical protein